jgi:protein gp37
VTAIEWCHRPGTIPATLNPIRARRKVDGEELIGWHCEPVTAGCDHCYSDRQNIVGARGGTKLPFKPGHRKDVEIYLDENTLLAPLSWRKPRTVFVCSMTDLFGAWVKDEWLDRIFAVMALTPQHTWIVLTKRPERMRAYLSIEQRPFAIADAALSVGRNLRDGYPGWSRDNWKHSVVKGCTQPASWPLPNVWCGTSVSEQADADRFIPELLATPAAIRFVSYEPALEPVDFTAIKIPRTHGTYLFDALRGEGRTHMGERFRSNIEGARLDQIIVGGESGSKARPFDVSISRDTLKQCRRAGTAFFMKQMGSFVVDRNDAGFDGCDETSWPEHIESEERIDFEPFGYVDEAQGAPCRIRLRDHRKGGDISEWPEDLRIREWPSVERISD